jgi:hypothetical protein
MKEYIKPELEVISLVAEEAITDDFVDGDTGLSDLPEGW